MFLFARGKLDPEISLQLFCRARKRWVVLREVELSHSGPGYFAGIADVEACCYVAGCARLRRKVRHVEAGVGEAKTERIERRRAIVLVASIPDEDALPIDDLVCAGIRVVVSKAWVIGDEPLPTNGKVAGGVDVAKE